jgi:hypothetical protein
MVDLTRDDLTEYGAVRKREPVIRRGKPSEAIVKPGTVANELLCAPCSTAHFSAKTRKL